MNIRENVKISTLTTMRIGGNARYVVEITTLDELKEAYIFAEQNNLPTFILGMGANTIGLDEGFDGVILLNKLGGVEILNQTENELVIKAMGGENWDELVAKTVEMDFSGMEALSLIPSTVGAAPVQNIGAYGQEAADIIESVDVFEISTKEFKTLSNQDCQFAYRQSIFNHGENQHRYFITAVTFRLHKNRLTPPFYTSLQKYLDEHHITDYSPQNIRDAVIAVRSAKLPDPRFVASAGSFFKNVYLTDEEADLAEQKGIEVWRNNGENKVNTGWLIDRAGLKGKIFHGFKVSETAALVLINESAKTYADLAAARQEIIDIVKKQFGFEIAQEPVELKV